MMLAKTSAFCVAVYLSLLSGSAEAQIGGLPTIQGQTGIVRDVMGSLNCAARKGSIGIGDTLLGLTAGTVARAAATVYCVRLEGFSKFKQCLSAKLRGDFENMKIVVWEPMVRLARWYLAQDEATRLALDTLRTGAITAGGSVGTGYIAVIAVFLQASAAVSFGEAFAIAALLPSVFAAGFATGAALTELLGTVAACSDTFPDVSLTSALPPFAPAK